MRCAKFRLRETGKGRKQVSSSQKLFIIINLKKTKYSLFHSSHQRKKIPEILPTLQIASNNIERDTVTKFLGVLIDENLSWKPHINVINSKVSKNIGLLYKARLFLNIYNLKQLYFSFVHSYLNYANIAWASKYT